MSIKNQARYLNTEKSHEIDGKNFFIQLNTKLDLHWKSKPRKFVSGGDEIIFEQFRCLISPTQIRLPFSIRISIQTAFHWHKHSWPISPRSIGFRSGLLAGQSRISIP